MADATMTVRINGQERQVPAGISVSGLLGLLELLPGMVVVEHNGEILRKDALASAPVAAGDALELVHFVGGG